jgi:hypothetical protein
MRFASLDEYMTFAHEAMNDGVRISMRSGLEIEVPDDYVNTKGKTSAQIEAELTPGPDPAVEAAEAAQAEAVEVVEALELPSTSATRREWAAYADSLGLDVSDRTKAEIIKMVEGA